MIELDREAARAVRIAAQGLAGGAGGGAGKALEDHGFVRTLGGVDVYLAVRARSPETSRADLDAAVSAGEARVVPAARGCIYLVARRDRALALRVAERLSRSRSERDAAKAGIRDGELEAVGRAVVAALREHGPLNPNDLRRALPDDAVRSLGDAGKKVGLSSTLPPALRRLEFAGEIERRHEGGRLDSERYLWALPDENPFADPADAGDPAGENARLAAVFLRAAGLATDRAFAAWSGLGVRDARAAMERAGAGEARVEGEDEPCRYAAATAELVESPPDVRDAVALLPFEDNLLALAGGPGFFVDEEHHGVMVPAWGRGKPAPLGEARHMSFRSVVAGGRVAGFWEYDPETEEVVTGLFPGAAKATRNAVAEAAAATARFLREDVGHGRSFSLDTDADLARRAGEIRSL